MDVVGWDDAAEMVVTEGMGVGAVAQSVSASSTINTRAHPGQQADGETTVVVVMDGEDGEPGAGLVGVEVESLCDSEGSVATELGVLIERVGDEGVTSEVRMEPTAGSGADQAVTYWEHTGVPLDDFSVKEASSFKQRFPDAGFGSQVVNVGCESWIIDSIQGCADRSDEIFV